MIKLLSAAFVALFAFAQAPAFAADAKKEEPKKTEAKKEDKKPEAKKEEKKEEPKKKEKKGGC
jgi:ribosomal protein L12E/L44/L45/RPP1/RPP2